MVRRRALVMAAVVAAAVLLGGRSTWIDLVVMVGVAIAALTAAVVAHRADERMDVPRVAPMLPGVARRFVTDQGLVVAVLAQSLVRRQRPRGTFTTVTADVAGEDPASPGRRAVVTWLASVAPNAYVVHVDTDTGSALVHQLHPAPPSVP